MNQPLNEYLNLESKEVTRGKKKETIPPTGLNGPKRIVIGIVREVIAPFINRSEPEEGTITTKAGDRLVVEVPARKFKSKEKLLGLRTCRAYDAVDPAYEYNAVKVGKLLANPNSILFGDSVVESGEQAMLPRKLLYSSSYSLEEAPDVTRTLTHNALSEMGTMWEREGGAKGLGRYRTSLFDTEYVLPGTRFTSFLVLDNGTPELLAHTLACLKETTYGAATSITGPNLRNEVAFLLGCASEPPVTSWTFSKGHGARLAGEKTSEVVKALAEAVASHEGVLVAGAVLATFMSQLEATDKQELYKRLKVQAEDHCRYAGIIPR